MNSKIRVGDLLVEQQVITPEQLQEGIEEHEKKGVKLGQALINLGYISEKQLLDILSHQLNRPLYDLTQYKYDEGLIKLLPEAYARRYRAIVLERNDDGLLIGMSDPMDIYAADEIKRVIKEPFNVALVRESDLLRTLDLVYRRTHDISAFAEKLDEEIEQHGMSLEDLMASEGQVDAPVVKLLQSVFEDAVQVGASDIHIEPDEKVLRIRLRVDGVLHEQTVKEKHIASAIALRLKLMSHLNMAEKRLPQDGRFNVKVRDKMLDVRLSTLPTQYGESVVMRLLDQTQGILNLGKIGMEPSILKRFRQLLHYPYGLILVTGPTGSGKSTTLYGGLNELNSPEKKMITVEDPVEYRLPRVNQVQVYEKIGLTFARVLRTCLRQDPDIMMVGEMRDKETAEIAIRSALTGHLVLSTLHTNDSASSATRLIDMGIEGFLVGATLRGILAQRLVRRICDSCKEASSLDEAEQSWLSGIDLPEIDTSKFMKGKGCAHCNQTGFKGRVGVFELLELNAEMVKALSENDSVAFSAAADKEMKGRLLVDNALKLAQDGVTTLSEVIRLSGEVE